MVLIYDIETTELEPFAKHARVTMIGVQKHDGTQLIFHDMDEAKMLKEFWDFAMGQANETWVGWNSIDFDRKYLLKRSIVLGITPNPSFGYKQKDLRKLIDPDKFAEGSLAKICELIDGSTKFNDWDGGDAVILFYQGKIDELEQYCKKDLKLTKKLYDQLIKVGLI